MSTYFSRSFRRGIAPASAICAATLFVGFLAGCGGGGDSSKETAAPVSRATGSLTLSVRWPDASRLIPKASQAIRVVVSATNNPNLSRTVVIARPAEGNTASSTISGLVPTEYRIDATAVPNADGTGVAQSVASATVTVVAETNVNAPRLELSSTIRSVRVRSNLPLPLRAGDVAVFSAEARTGADGTGDIVLTDPSNLTWRVVSGNVSGIRQDSGTFTVTASGTGDVVVEVSDSESGVGGSLPFAVSPAGPPPPTIAPVTPVIDGVEAQSSEGYAINANGQVVGRATVGNVSRPFRTRPDGTVEVLAAETGQANGVNGNGDVIGTMRSGTERRAFLWKANESGVLDLGFLNANPSGNNFSEGNGINDSGEMVGYAKDWCGCWRSFRTAPFSTIKKGDGNLNDADGFTQWGDDIGTIAPEVFKVFIHTFAYGITNNRRVGGFSTAGQFGNDANNPDAILNAGSLIYNPFASPTTGLVTQTAAINAAPDKPDAVIRAINENGDAAGWAGDVITLPDTWREETAVIRLSGEALTKLPPLPGASGADTSRAYAINNAREVVGYAFKGGQKCAFLYRDGVMTELNTLLPADSGWVLEEARGINSRGQITGIGVKDGKKQAFLLSLRP